MSEAVLRFGSYKADIEKDQISRRDGDHVRRPVLAPPIQIHRNISSHIALVAENTQSARVTTALDRVVNETLAANIQRCDRQHRQMRILAATIQVCSEMGMRTANIAEIAKRARVSTATLYQDFETREKLVEAATIFATPLVFGELMASVAETRPKERLCALLTRQCTVINHPHTQWLFSTYVCRELPQTLATHEVRKETHQNIADIWRLELQILHDQGVLAIPKMDMAINFILGAIYRQVILVESFFGGDNAAELDLETAAAIAVEWLFEQFGAHK